MPLIGHFFDKVGYGSLYYMDKPNRSLTYSKKNNINLKLHFFEPSKKKSESTVLFFHGGAWAFGSSYSLFKICRDISNQGITCISADYRIALKHNSKVKDSMDDAREAYKWVTSNAEILNLDPENIIVGGGSSGGQLAASLAMIPDENNQIITKIKGLILLNPALNTSVLDREIPENIEERRKKLWLFVKKLFEGNFVKFSPSNYIKEGLPPSIILHGKSDKTIPIEIVEKFSNDMIEKGNVVKFLKWEGKGHQFYRWDKEAYPEVMSELIKFIKEN
tara:strand:+ start:442 stop:1272 length:831 start_codon:yes stop_codon:yes gene_type:complete